MCVNGLRPMSISEGVDFRRFCDGISPRDKHGFLNICLSRITRDRAAMSYMQNCKQTGVELIKHIMHAFSAGFRTNEALC